MPAVPTLHLSALVQDEVWQPGKHSRRQNGVDAVGAAPRDVIKHPPWLTFSGGGGGNGRQQVRNQGTTEARNVRAQIFDVRQASLFLCKGQWFCATKIKTTISQWRPNWYS